MHGQAQRYTESNPQNRGSEHQHPPTKLRGALMLRIPNLHGGRMRWWRSRECVGVFLLGGLRQSERTLRSQRQLDCILVPVLVIAHPGLHRGIAGVVAHLALKM